MTKTCSHGYHPRCCPSGVCPDREALGLPGETKLAPEPCGKCGPATVGFVGKEYAEKTGMKVGDEILVPGKDVPEPERCHNCDAIIGEDNSRAGENETGCQRCHVPEERGAWLDVAQTVRDYLETHRPATATMREIELHRVALLFLDVLVTWLGELEEKASKEPERVCKRCSGTGKDDYGTHKQHCGACQGRGY